MMFIVALIGLVPSICSGWLLMQSIEGHTPVFGRIERWAYAALLGPGLTMVVAFVASVGTGLPLSRLGFGLVHLLVLAGAALAWHFRARGVSIPVRQQVIPVRLPAWAAGIGVVLMTWTAIKVFAAGTMFLFLTPTFLDDTLDNWNLRAKVFFETQSFTVELPRVSAQAVQSSVSSYPPPVSLLKAWLVTLVGEWSDAVANIPHLLWFLVAIAIIAAAVCRYAGRVWGMIAVYTTVSLPLYLIHGTNAYADTFLSAYIAAAVLPVVFSLFEHDAGRRKTWLRIAAVMTGMLIFTKNEASVLYLPPLLAVTGAALWNMWRKGALQRSDVKELILWYGCSFVLLGLPWLSYKWMHGLAFGNAKQISALQLQWHDGVGLAIAVNTFFEGNWILLFPLTFILIALRWKESLRTPLAVLTAFFLMTYVLQLFVFFFTPLAYEAIKQTGYARGLVHLIPVIIVLTLLLMKKTIDGILPEWAKR